MGLGAIFNSNLLLRHLSRLLGISREGRTSPLELYLAKFGIWYDL